MTPRVVLSTAVLALCVVTAGACGGGSSSGSGTVPTRTAETASVEAGIKDQLSSSETIGSVTFSFAGVDGTVDSSSVETSP